MPDLSDTQDFPTCSLPPQVERIVNQFEEDWQLGPRPDIDAYLSRVGGDRLSLLVELVLADLEFRLKRNEPARVETYQERYPELAEHPPAILRCIAHEYEIRRRREPGLDAEEYSRRFPHLRDLLSMHLRSENGQPGSVAPANGASTTPLATTPEIPTPPDPTWPVVPGYDILALLGRGSMGIVYKARHRRLKRLVALKMLRDAGLGPSRYAERFRTEAEAAARLQHPHLVQIHEIGEHGGQPFLALEYVEGTDLRKRLASGPFALRAALILVETLARAMQHAHERGVIHRDLKPANVLMTATGEPKISDFGIAKQLDAGADPTASDVLLGTPAYMAPEQVPGKDRRVGPTSDVYSLGAILYELVTGRPPFRADTPLETIRAVVSDEVLAPRRLAPRLPRDVETICLKCLHKEPHRRYPTALALAEDLRRYLDGQSIHARPASRLERAGKWARRHPAWTALAAVVLLAGVAVAVLTARHTAELGDRLRDTRAAQEEARAKERIARRHRYAADVYRADQAWRAGDVSDAVALLDQNQPRTDDPEDFRGFEWHYLRRLTTSGEPATVWRAPGELSFAALAPDGRSLATGHPDGTVQLWDIATWKRRPPLAGLRREVHWLAFGDGGKVLAGADTAGTIVLWDAATGRARGQWSEPAAALAPPTLSPDGRTLALVQHPPRAGVHDHIVKWWFVDGKAGHRSNKGTSPTGPPAFTADGRTLVFVREGPGRPLEFWDVAGGRGARGAAWECPGDVLPVPAALGTGMFGIVDARGTLRFLDGKGGWGEGLRGHTAPVRALARSGDGAALASAGDDNTVHLWDYRAGTIRNVFRGHRDRVWGVAFAPDGRHLLSVSRDGTVRRWPLGWSQPCRPLLNPRQAAGPVAFGPRGRRLVVAYRDRTVRLSSWDRPGGEMVLSGHTGDVACLAFAPDGRTLATGCADGTLRLWDLTTGTLRQMLPPHPGGVRCLAFTPDGKVLASAGADRGVRLWTITAPHGTPRVLPHAAAVTGLAFSPDGRRLGTTSANRLHCWDWQAGKPLWEKTNGSPVLSVAFAPDGRWLASGEENGTVSLWQAMDGTRHMRRKRAQPVRGVTFSPDGRKVICAQETATFWEVSGHPEPAQLWGHRGGVLGVACAPGGRLATTGLDGCVKLWGTNDWRLHRQLDGSLPGVNALAFSPDGTTLAVGCNDSPIEYYRELLPPPPGLTAARGLLPPTRAGGVVRDSGAETVTLWAMPAGRKVGGLIGPHPGVARALAFNPDGKTLVAGTSIGALWRWDPATRQAQASLFADRIEKEYWEGVYKLSTALPCVPFLPTPEHDSIRDVAVSARGGLMAAVLQSGTVKLWDAATGKERMQLPGEHRDAACAAFSPDGRFLATHDRADVQVWDLAAGEWRFTLRGHKDVLRSLAFSPDGALLASGSKEGQIKLWDLATGRLAATLVGHTDSVAALAFTPDGKTLASGSHDMTVKLWSTFSKRELATLTAHHGRVTSVAFSPDGKTLASGATRSDGGGEVLLWETTAADTGRSRPAE